MSIAKTAGPGLLDSISAASISKVFNSGGGPAGSLRRGGWPAKALACAAIVLCYIFAGLLGHDPWKADEAYVFGVIHHMLETGDWVVPTLAGEPFMEKPPLFYWTATAMAWLLQGVLPLHDGARLASGLFMLLACGATAATARKWWGAGTGRYAALALLACLGSLEQSHLMMPDIPLLASFALSALGFASILDKPVRGGALIGTALGMGFMAKGLLGPAVMGATALLLPLLFAHWRRRAYWHGLAIAALVCVPWCVVWPACLYLRSPKLFMDWFWVNNIGRFLGFSVQQLGTEHLPWFWTKTIPWFTFPALPIALWTLWRQRRTALATPAVQYALVAFSVLMLVLATSSSARCVYAWPLLVPLALLAAPGAQQLPKRIDLAFSVLGIALFGMLMSAVLLGWLMMMVTGAPPDWPRLLRLLPAEFIPYFDATHALAALLLIAGALVVLKLLWSAPARGLTVWLVGVTLTWALLTTLWMPWLDFAKSYRPVFAAMPIPQQTNCLSSINLGEGERAMLRYVTGRNPVRREVAPDAACSALLVQREVAHGEPDIDLAEWREVWRGSRPGVTNERFWLFERRGAAGNVAASSAHGMPHAMSGLAARTTSHATARGVVRAGAGTIPKL